MFNPAPFKFYGFIQVLQDRFHELWYKRQIDLGRFETVPLFKLLVSSAFIDGIRRNAFLKICIKH